MWHHHFLELHVAANRFQFTRDVPNGLRRLGRPGQARPDVVCEMRHLPISVIAAQRGLLKSFQISQRKFSRAFNETCDFQSERSCVEFRNAIVLNAEDLILRRQPFVFCLSALGQCGTP